ncbi:MAG: tetratricopeptide repeat protein [Parvibaculaceae bacterium]|nr:tetratricopeptide repeat protein [Parvibaculaceae bacterium]
MRLCGDRQKKLALLTVLGALAWQMPGMALVISPAQAETSAPAVTPSEASGMALYKRGLYPEALAEWKKAVEERHDMGAAYQLGVEYLDAKVVKRDVPTAMRYYRLAAEGGDARAQMDLGSLYDAGSGLKEDPGLAAKYYLAAAEQGLPTAQYNIAVMYESGTGIAKDPARAYMYFYLADKAGFEPYAATELERLTKTLPPEKIRQGTLLAENFKPRKVSFAE